MDVIRAIMERPNRTVVFGSWELERDVTELGTAIGRMSAGSRSTQASSWLESNMGYGVDAHLYWAMNTRVALLRTATLQTEEDQGRQRENSVSEDMPAEKMRNCNMNTRVWG